MSDSMTLFKGGNSLVSADLMKALMDMNKTLTGGGMGAGKRLSIRGRKFRMMDGGDQVAVAKGDSLDVVIVNAAQISRTYFEGTYDPENPAPPTCWSADTVAPSPDVPADQRCSARCADCKNNVKGSGANNGRACRFAQRLAVTLIGKPDEVYQLQVPATSIFGDAVGGNMGMQAYAKFLSAHNTPAIAVVTRMTFDDESDVPKLYFAPVRALDEAELEAALAARDSEDAVRAVTITVSQTDGVAKKSGSAQPPAEPPKTSSARSAPADDDDVIETSEETPQPKKRAAAPKSAPKVKDISALVAEWGDDDDN